jgi:sugar lactone lactonase YvrE
MTRVAWFAALFVCVAAQATHTSETHTATYEARAMFESTLQPFAKGDIFVGVTQLNNPNDDHAGRGRIIQYDAAGHEKGVLWLKETTHLVGGLKFDARGVLWAFDSQGFVIINVHPSGKVVQRREFPQRPFSHVNFARDGSLFLGEHVVGNSVKPEIAARMHTQIPLMPGGDRFGDGHVWHFKPNGALIKEYATQTHGGMGGFLGVTMSTLSPDESTLVYCSETGPRLMRYDLKNDRQLPDLQSSQPPFQGPPEMFFGMEYSSDGTLYVLRGARIDVVSDTGQTTRQISLPGFGWAIMDITTDGKYAYVGSFFSGDVLKVELASGTQLGTIKTGGVKALAGVVEYQGEGTADAVVAPRAPRPRNKRPMKKRAAPRRRPSKAQKRRSKPARLAAKKRVSKKRAPMTSATKKRSSKRSARSKKSTRRVTAKRGAKRAVRRSRSKR